MEGFSRLLNYLGNVKARIMSQIVRISFEKFLRLPARCARACDNHAGFSRRMIWRRARPCPVIGRGRARGVELNNGRLNWGGVGVLGHADRLVIAGWIELGAAGAPGGVFD
ncbi:hypothetical protein [Bradyrhizobium sp. 930_D9_N1_4]|uniref:hypothetical protein n=1 Tax=Bradyrhizobium sp. 930_D9_N1_4 TaxID=3240374 RepID=UPI003F8A6AA0